MTDIVEKLKDACVIDRHYGKSVTLTLDYDDYMEAADLITALRAENERLTGERDRQYDQNAEQIIRIAALEAENEKLRAALEMFACDCVENDLCKLPHACRNYVARAALEEKP